MMNINCNYGGGISKVYIIQMKDVVIENGVIIMKRKYGKFKREVLVHERDKPTTRSR